MAGRGLPDDGLDSFALDWHHETGGKELAAALSAAASARQELATVEQRAATTLEAAARAGTRAGLSVRDIAAMTRVSFQRVSQVLTSAGAVSGRRARGR